MVASFKVDGAGAEHGGLGFLSGRLVRDALGEVVEEGLGDRDASFVGILL